MFRNNSNNEKYFFRLSFLIVIISTILDLYYRYFIVNRYGHLGFELSVNPFKYLLTKALLIGLLYLSYLIFERSLFLYGIFLLLLFFFYLPNSILFSLMNGSWKPFLSNLFFVSTFYFSTFISFKIPEFNLPVKLIDLFLIVIALLCVIPIFIYFKDNVVLNTLLLKEIYSTREIFSERMTGVINYLYHISVKTILPVTLIHFLIRRKTYHVIGIIFILLYLFMISGNKIVYFNSFLIILFYLLHSDYIKKLNLYFQITILALILFPLIDYSFLSDTVLTGTFVNRFLFIPALLTQWYFDFFDGHPFYFAESHFFNHFTHSPYNMPVGFLISKTYLHTTDTFANNGIVSDGFMNLGFTGVVLFSLLFTALFGFFHNLKLNPGYYGLYFSYVYMFLSAPFLSCFITGGVFIFLILAVFMLNFKEEEIT